MKEDDFDKCSGYKKGNQLLNELKQAQQDLKLIHKKMVEDESESEDSLYEIDDFYTDDEEDADTTVTEEQKTSQDTVPTPEPVIAKEPMKIEE